MNMTVDPNLNPDAYIAQRNELMVANYQNLSQYFDFCAHEIQEGRIDALQLSESSKSVARFVWNMGMSWMNEAILWHQIDKRSKLAVVDAAKQIDGLMNEVEGFLGRELSEPDTPES